MRLLQEQACTLPVSAGLLGRASLLNPIHAGRLQAGRPVAGDVTWPLPCLRVVLPLCRCVAVPLCCCAAVPLCCCAAVLLCRCQVKVAAAPGVKLAT